MKIQYLIFILHLILLAQALASSQKKGTKGLAGAPSGQTPVSDEKTLNVEYKRINDFVRRVVPQVKDFKLTGYRHQVVAGKKYYLTYSPATPSTTVKDIVITVWSKPWENNFLKTKRPNGKVIKEGGKPASAKKVVKPAPGATASRPAPATAAKPASPSGTASPKPTTTKTS